MTDETRQSSAETVSHGWRCFHCDELFANRAAAAEHFGASEIETPACKLNALEGGLLGLVRRQAEQIDAYHREDTASYREFYSIGADHARALIKEEQKGYDRGLADAGHADSTNSMLRIVLGNQLAMMGALHLLLRGFLSPQPLQQDRLSARISATRVLTDAFEQLTNSHRPTGD